MNIVLTDHDLAPDEVPYWTASGSSLDAELDVEDHYQVQELVKAMLDDADAALITFDSEMSAFVAYADTREPLDRLDQVVERLVNDKDYRDEAAYRVWGDDR